MRKVLLALIALVMAAPAMADVVITVTDAGSGVAEISYDASGEASLPRGFGLNIEVDAGVIVSVDTSGCQPFDIYMGTIQFGGEPLDITDYGTPVAPKGSPGAVGGELGVDAAITVEMGSLYEVGVDTPPLDAGLLIKVEVSASCNMTVTLNTTRGGVVLEAEGEVTVDLTAATNVAIAVGPTFDPAHPDYQTWLDNDSPDCWLTKYQCLGDADGLALGDPKKGYFHVEYIDLGMVLASWKDDPVAKGSLWVEGTSTWDICPNFDREELGDPKKGYFHVEYLDLGIVLANWKKTEAEMDALLPVGGCGGTVHTPHN